MVSSCVLGSDMVSDQGDDGPGILGVCKSDKRPTLKSERHLDIYTGYARGQINLEAGNTFGRLTSGALFEIL